VPRALTVRATEVAPAQQAGYLARLGEEARRAKANGANLWVFRHSSGDGRFLEFREAQDPAVLDSGDDDLWLEQTLPSDGP